MSSYSAAVRTAFLLPYVWFRNITRLLEKRSYGAYPLLLFCAFVGIARMLGEWLIGAHPLRNVISEVFGFTVFYWHLFFAYGLILFLLVPQQPWRKSINVILVGIFLGLVPPIIDFFAYDLATVRYAYFWTFPEEWNWLLYNPARDFYFGETFVLWLTMALTAAYVGYKTRSWGRSGLAALLSYGVVVAQGAVLPSALHQLWTKMEWKGGHLVYMMFSAQILVALTIYVVMQPALRKGLFHRAQHALPFVMMSLLGAAFAGGVTGSTFWYAGLVFLAFLTALIQNDYHDAADDAVQGRVPYVDLEDVRFFTISMLMLVMALFVVNSLVGTLLLLILILSFLYSYPFYHAKRYFPSNLKIEGCWGLTSFLVGMIGTMEHQLNNMPRWELPGAPEFGQDLDYPGLGAIVAAFLVFGGHTLLAILKDYKDVEADSLAGVRTVYTLAKARGLDLLRVHRIVAVASLFCIALPLPLLYLREMITRNWMMGGFLGVALISVVIVKVNRKKMFDLFLWLMSGYLLYLFVALLASRPL